MITKTKTIENVKLHLKNNLHINLDRFWVDSLQIKIDRHFNGREEARKRYASPQKTTLNRIKRL
jgi:hypothetical protein